MNNIDCINKDKCVGCGACYNNCSQNAIQILTDEYGFYYPRINPDKCSNCGACLHSCPINSHSFHEVQQAYAVTLVDKRIKKNSSSGGAFFWIASSIIQQGGVIYGAAFDANDRLVKHIRVDSENELSKLQNSKYVQSYIGDTFLLARRDLSQGKRVLFSGTPCQIAGLYSCLGHDYDNLYTCDILCYGVPSPLVLKSYLNDTVGDNRIVKLNMRDKTKGWKQYSMRITTDNSDYLKDKNEDPFHLGFQTHIFYRESCYSCAFRRNERVGDFSLGDFWNFKESFKKESIVNDESGISFMTINTAKALSIYERLNKELVRIEVRSFDENKDNFGFKKGMEISPDREVFFERLNNEGYCFAIQPYINYRYNRISVSRRIYRWFKRNYYFRKLLHSLGIRL